MGDGSLKEPHSYVKKGDRMNLRISHLEPEKRRVGFTQRWGTAGEDGKSAETPAAGDAPVGEATVTDAPAADAADAPAAAE
jgi:small subunit ribosomal protein S1